MSKLSKYCVLIVVAGCLLAQASVAADGVNGNLVSAKWLEKNVGDPNLVLLDASPAQLFGAKHIAGALPVDFLRYGLMDVPLAETEAMYQSWGVSPSKKVVIYDQGATYLATRLFFSLEYHGFPMKNLFVLDGGLSKWQAEGLPVTAEITPPPAKGTFRIGKINEAVRVRLPEFLTATGDLENNALIEALGADWHYGEVAAFEKGGHIPNAILTPTPDYFNADKTFKSAEEIKKMLDYLKVRPEQTLHSHCGGGVSASAPYFALKYIAGYPKVKMFVESQLGWRTDERELPYWTYDVPSLMRSSDWLKSWGGPMMRMYGVSKVSVVDVRPAAAYSEGHVPFALNIPADVFRSNLATPEKLAAVLGAAGVDASHEAVVLSGAGITKEAALAFVMLEKLGQRKVSVLTDPTDKWAKPGFALTRTPTVVAPKKTGSDPSVPPTVYPAKLRKDVVISDPTSTAGVYPRVIIASGATLPAKTCDSKMVHVPYTELLNADGTPKAAKDIWNILAKAGVPRYGELVCVSDDPGEAAANYYVLKLMGFPDIKMMAM